MSSTTDYNELLPVISAINPANVLTPNIPIDVFVQESENLYHWSKDDQQALTKVGLNWNSVLSLPARAGACREAQSLWIKERKPASNPNSVLSKASMSNMTTSRLTWRPENLHGGKIFNMAGISSNMAAF